MYLCREKYNTVKETGICLKLKCIFILKSEFYVKKMELI